jgi:hypothetical protein
VVLVKYCPCKRVILATLSGFVCGLICNALASSGGYEMPWPITAQIISSRILIGLAIGVSSLKMPWVIHGLLMGTLFSFPMAFSGLMAAVPGFSPSAMFMSTVLMGTIYGFLIELVTSVIFKAKNK